MSVVKKQPEIEKILGRLNATQLSTLRTALNSTTFETPKSLIDPNYKLATVDSTTTTDIGSYRLQLDAQKTRNGFMVRIYLLGTVYENFLVYGESQKITIYEIDSVNRTYRLIEEYCDINELRRVINDIGGEESHEGVFTNLHVENDLTVDGKSELTDVVDIGDPSTVTHSTLLGVHGDTQIHGELMIDDLTHFQNPDGEQLIQVIDKATFEGGSFVTKTGVVYIVYDTDASCYVRYYVS